MNTLVVFFAACAVVVFAQGPSPDMKNQMDTDLNACKASEKATDDDVNKFKAHQQPTTQTGKCLVGCMMTQAGFLKNGAFSRTSADDHARKNIKDATMLQNILKSNLACEKEVGAGTDKCVTGPKLVQCMEKNLPARGPPGK